MSEFWLVQLEIKRVQTFLFEVPTLKAMVGANSLLGEVCRGHWDGGKFSSQSIASRAATAALPSDVEPVALLDLPATHQGDLLDDDNPAEAWQQGILVRDASRIQAVFPTKPAADDFVRSARSLVEENLPGIRLAPRVLRLVRDQLRWKSEEPEVQAADEADLGMSLPMLPQLQMCHVTGNTVASKMRSEASGEPETPVARTVIIREQQEQLLHSGQAQDVVGQILPALWKFVTESEDAPKWPRRFDDIAQSGHLAVILADGNGIGSRARSIRSGTPAEGFFQTEAKLERFFFDLRSSFRGAFARASRQIFHSPWRFDRNIRFRPLMLGGDDLLLVCDAPFALPFAHAYSSLLEESVLADGRKPTVGIGVAIVPLKFPFYRAHALAEELTESAKILHRGQESATSTVDWIAVTESWHGGVADLRRQQYVRKVNVGAAIESHLLTLKPYPICGPRPSLEDLLVASKRLLRPAEGVARNKLKLLAQSMLRGRWEADLVYQTLPTETKVALEDAGMPSTSLWTELSEASSIYYSGLLDLLEVYELDRQCTNLRTKREAKRA